MENNSPESRGRILGRKIHSFFSAIPSIVLLVFMPLIALLACIGILNFVSDYHDLPSALVLSTLIASYAYYIKR